MFYINIHYSTLLRNLFVVLGICVLHQYTLFNIVKEPYSILLRNMFVLVGICVLHQNTLFNIVKEPIFNTCRFDWVTQEWSEVFEMKLAIDF